jgi:TetR/AcrR family transcriptional repressor of bet genes
MARQFDPVAQQQAISEALWRVMSSGGPQKLTVRAVADEAGCSTGLVMHRFPNKKMLLVHARRMLHEGTQDRLELEAAAHTEARDALDAVLLSSLLGEEFDARIWVGYLAAAIGETELTAVHVDAHQQYLDIVARLVRSSRPDWDAERVHVSSVSLVGLATGLAALSAVGPDVYSRETQEASMRSTISAVVDRP